jgi:hypothetical protein
MRLCSPFAVTCDGDPKQVCTPLFVMATRFLLALALSVAALAFQGTVPSYVARIPPSASVRSAWWAKQRLGRSKMYAVKEDPQAFASGYSPKLDLLEAIQEATEIALQALPTPRDDVSIDLALVIVSSLYDGQSPPSVVVPAVLSSASVYGNGIQKLIGCTSGGIVASMANVDAPLGNKADDAVQPRACNTVESEGIPGVPVTLCLLPGVTFKVRCRKTFLSLPFFLV